MAQAAPPDSGLELEPPHARKPEQEKGARTKVIEITRQKSAA